MGERIQMLQSESGDPAHVVAEPQSDALRSALLMLLAFGHDGGAEPAAEVFRKFVELRIAVDLDGFLGGVANDVTVVAPGKVVFELDLGFFVENAIQIIGQLV
jgi:hypothetical protein